MFLVTHVSLQVDYIAIAWLEGQDFRYHLKVHFSSILGGANLYMLLHPSWFQSI